MLEVKASRFQKFLIPVFSWVYQKRLVRNLNVSQGGGTATLTVVKVKGWRTALVDYPEHLSTRETVSFLFKFFKWYI